MLKYVLSRRPGNRGDAVTIHVWSDGYCSVTSVRHVLDRIKRDRPRKIFADVPACNFVDMFLQAGFDYADYADYPDDDWDHKSRCFLMFAPRGL